MFWEEDRELWQAEEKWSQTTWRCVITAGFCPDLCPVISVGRPFKTQHIYSEFEVMGMNSTWARHTENTMLEVSLLSRSENLSSNTQNPPGYRSGVMIAYVHDLISPMWDEMQRQESSWKLLSLFCPLALLPPVPAVSPSQILGLSHIGKHYALTLRNAYSLTHCFFHNKNSLQEDELETAIICAKLLILYLHFI